ncbi:hypothetical protein [Polyangium sp. 15x6]|uniref:hypothetical protein n=1 Tax=Polyangium sp. 15x6 TaxID=3042687 RepID=UPI00249CA6F2|nr:hypothetical protein [Polyangium sp. 15x6]MDI3283633.1 hypothetical protein [Polyangium sp. 15x6]
MAAGDEVERAADEGVEEGDEDAGRVDDCIGRGDAGVGGNEVVVGLHDAFVEERVDRVERVDDYVEARRGNVGRRLMSCVHVSYKYERPSPSQRSSSRASRSPDTPPSPA